MIVALNMSDEAQKEGIIIHQEQLSSILGVPCIKVSASTKQGIEKLINRLVDVLHFPHEKSKLIYSDVVEEEIENIVHFFEQKRYRCEMSYRDLALKLLQEDTKTYQKMHDEPIWMELMPLLQEALGHLYIHYESKDIAEIFAQEHAAFAKGAVLETVTYQKSMVHTLTDKIDSLLIHPLFGIPIFLFLMWGLFQLTFTLGSIPMDYICAFLRLLENMPKRFLVMENLAL